MNTPANASLPRTARWWDAPWATWTALLLIVLLGAYFRGINLFGWEGGFGFHPDESFFQQTTTDVQMPSSLGEYFDSAVSPLNPRNRGHGLYVYGLLPITITRWVGDHLPKANIVNVGRSMATLFDLGSIVLVFFLGRLIHGRRVGLLAALLAALAAMSIQQSHFFTVDTVGVFFVLLSLYWSVRIAQGGGWLSYVAAGVSIGLAVVGGRITMATLGLVVTVAALQASFHAVTRPSLRLIGDDPTGTSSFEPEPEEVPNTLDRSLGRFFSHALPLLILAGVCTLLVFRIGQPDAFIGSRPDSPPPSQTLNVAPSALDRLQGWGFFDIRLDPRYLDNLKQSAGFASGAIDWPPSVQWANRTSYLFPLQNMILWGMGVPLGILVWIGWALVGWQIVRHRWFAPLTLWVWVSFYFVWQGAQFAKTMRYMLPIYGPLILFGAWALVALWDWSRRQKAEGRRQKAEGRSWGLAAARWSLLIVTIGTFCWAYAFTRIYTRPHTRLTASRWMLDNIPSGSYIGYEHWDYTLPVHADGRDPWSIYKGVELPLYAEDDLSKYIGSVDSNNLKQPGLIDKLDQVNYIVLSSNRIYDSIVRLPMRYPATIRYYRYLFDGELGFELAADVTSYPTFLGLPIPDQGAEEAFSVYDHPRVLVFRKTANYSHDRVQQLLTADINWNEVYKLPTIKGGAAPSALRFTPSQWPLYQQAGTWAAMFSPVGQIAPVLVWLIVLELLGLAGFALLFHFLPQMPDRGWALAKILALLLVAYAAWLLGSLRLMAFTPTSVWLCAAPLLALGAWVAWRSRLALRSFWHERRVALLTGEGVFLLLFFAMLLVRFLNPDLWHPARGGEKPMDLAFLTATLKSASFPPYDPWFAGGYLNYYYFGFVIVGTLIHLTGVVPSIAYNLAVPTIFALTGLGSWGVVYNLLAPVDQRQETEGQGLIAVDQEDEGATQIAPEGRIARLRSSVSRLRSAERRAIASGLLAVLFVLLMGNLAQAIWYLPGTANPPAANQPAQQAASRLTSYAAQQIAQGREEWAFWDATRLIDGTVNEFPFFTFLFADLHAHMIVMPLSLAVLGLTVALARGARNRAAPRELSIVLLLGLLTGALRVTNTWDYPIFTGLTAVTLGLVVWERYRREEAGGPMMSMLLGDWRLPLWVRALLVWVAELATILVLGTLLFWPFISHFTTESSGAQLWRDARTPLWDWLRINGVWLFLLVSALMLLARRYLHLSRLMLTLIPIALFGVLAIGLFTHLSAPILLLSLVFVVAPVAWFMRRSSTRVQLPMLWGVAGLALSLLVDLVVVKGDVGRMNTVFKFGLHTWILFALTSAVALPWIWGTTRRWRVQSAIAWRIAAGLLIAGGLVYPVTATPSRIADRYAENLPHTLDGTAFMQTVNGNENGNDFPLKADADAIAWIQENISGSPVMLEAQLPSYHWAGRIAIYTGLPTLLGWEWHEIQQRSAVNAQPIVDSRKTAIQQIYGTPDANLASKLIHDYGIEYVYVGGLEHALYDPAGFAKFDTLAQQGTLERVYNQENTQIYRVKEPFEDGILTTDLPIIKPNLRTVPSQLLDKSLADQPAVNEYAWNGLANISSWAALVFWLVAIYILALLGLPISVLIFGRWRDGGWTWARLIGLLALGYAVWLPASLHVWSYNRWGLLIGTLLVLAVDAATVMWMGTKTESEGPKTEVDEHEEIQTEPFVAPLRTRQTFGLSSFVPGLRALWQHLLAHRRAVLISEGLFLASFAVLAVLRAFNPDLWHPVFGGEKPMEFGFLNAILRSPSMPPYDPFFSNGFINYYYYGTFLVSLLIKATGIAPGIGFNLAIATVFALTLVAGYAIVAELTGRVRYGLLGAAMFGVLGNLGGVLQVGSSSGIAPLVGAVRSQGLGALGHIGQAVGDSWFWGPSRIVPDAINEFPFWSFLFADLHAHLVALPITLLAIALAYRILDTHSWSLVDSSSHVGRVSVSQAATLALCALTLGALAVTNSWDFPTYTLLIGAALVGRAWRAKTINDRGRMIEDAEAGVRSPSVAHQMWGVLRAGVLAVLVALGGMLLYAPFFDHYYALVSGLGRVEQGTPVGYYGVIYALFLVILLPVIFGAAWRFARVSMRFARPSRRAPMILRASLVGLAVLLVGGVLMQPGAGLQVVVGVLLLVSVGLLLPRRFSTITWFTLLMAAVAWAVSLGVELVYIRDHLDGSSAYRMNTIFKFGVQIWTLLALAAAASLPRLLRALCRIGGAPLETVAGAVLVVLLICGAVFPIVGTASRLASRFPNPSAPTLDGLAFMRGATFSYDCQQGGCQPGVDQATIDLTPDADAIDWLNTNITGTPIVLQSSLWFYRAYGVRIAANTGLPTVISDLHANEQHDPAATGQRSADVGTIYNSASTDDALRLLAKYAVNYIYVGSVERAFYAPAGLKKFDTMVGSYLDVAYDKPGVRIYKVHDLPVSMAQPKPFTFPPDPLLPVPAAQPAPAAQSDTNQSNANQPAPDANTPDLATLEARVATAPTNAPAAFGLGQAYRAAGRRDDAVRVLRVAADANPKDVALHQVLGDILSELKRYDEATQAYNEAIVASPTAGNLNKLGSAQLAWGRLDEAMATLSKAIATDPNAADPHYFMGQLLVRQGENAKARTELNRYLELAPNGSWAGEATRILGTLK